MVKSVGLAEQKSLLHIDYQDIIKTLLIFVMFMLQAVVGTVVLTNQCLLLLDAKYVVKSRILVNDIKNVYLSPYRDGMIVVHSTPEVS